MRNSQLSCTNSPSSSAFCLLWWQRMCYLERACKFGPFLASHSPCTFLVSRTVALVTLDGLICGRVSPRALTIALRDLVNSSSALTSCLHDFVNFNLLLSKLKSSCLFTLSLKRWLFQRLDHCGFLSLWFLVIPLHSSWDLETTLCKVMKMWAQHCFLYQQNNILSLVLNILSDMPNILSGVFGCCWHELTISWSCQWWIQDSTKV